MHGRYIKTVKLNNSKNYAAELVTENNNCSPPETLRH